MVVYIEIQSYKDIPGISGRWRFTCTLNFSQMGAYIEFQSDEDLQYLEFQADGGLHGVI